MKKTFLTAIFLSLFCIANFSWSEMDVRKFTKLAKGGDAEAQNNYKRSKVLRKPEFVR
jgi:hypothetical protein